MGLYYPDIMQKTLLVDIITYFFILLFVYTGVAKLMEVHLFKEQLVSSPFLGSLAGVITWALPIGELLLAIALFIPKWRLKALYVTLSLMSFFTIYVIVIFFMDDHLSCSCGGIIEELSPRQHILFNSACVILAAVAIAILRRRQEATRRFNWLTGTSALCLFLVVGWVLFAAFSAPVTLKTGLEGRLLPSFNLLLTDSVTRLNTADIPTGKPLIVIGFSPSCTHCQAETRDIIKNIDQFKDIRIYYMTPYPFDQMQTFYRYFKLSRYPNIVMGRDSTNTFMSYFKAQGVPFIGVFDSRKRLLQAVNSQINVERLVQMAAQ